MTTNEILTVLKTDLQISAKQYDAYLTNIITLAKAAIEREGIILSCVTGMGMLIMLVWKMLEKIKYNTNIF